MQKSLTSLVILGFCVVTTPALAADLPSGKDSPEAPLTEAAPLFEFYGAVDGSPNNMASQELGLTAALTQTLDESGFRFHIGGSHESYQYPLDAPLSVNYGRDWTGSASVGYEFVTDQWSVLGLIGANVENGHINKPDPSNEVQGTRAGFEPAVEIDGNPTPNTMFYAYGSYSTAFDTAFAEVRPGLSVFSNVSLGGVSIKNVYLGPAFQYSSDLHDNMYVIGAHLTLSEIGPAEATLIGGYDHDEWNGAGGYGELAFSIRF